VKDKEDDQDTKEEPVVDAILHFVKVVLLRKSEGWRFIYKEIPITASIKPTNAKAGDQKQFDIEDVNRLIAETAKAHQPLRDGNGL